MMPGVVAEIQTHPIFMAFKDQLKKVHTQFISVMQSKVRLY
jgi:hypothetical protein